MQVQPEHRRATGRERLPLHAVGTGQASSKQTAGKGAGAGRDMPCNVASAACLLVRVLSIALFSSPWHPEHGTRRL
jgi:hypothetical protein